MKVINPIHFFSLVTMQPMPFNSTDSIIIPQMLKNDEFTKTFIDASEDMG